MSVEDPIGSHKMEINRFIWSNPSQYSESIGEVFNQTEVPNVDMCPYCIGE